MKDNQFEQDTQAPGCLFFFFFLFPSLFSVPRRITTLTPVAACASRLP